MFKIGDHVVYGSKGVCAVADITQMKMPGAEMERPYYVLHPVWDAGARVYLPADSEKAVIRKVITEEEGKQLIEEIPDIACLAVAEDKKREQDYKDVMRTCDCRRLISLIKTLAARKEERIAAGKKNTALDERYLRVAEHELYDELAIALNQSKEEVTVRVRSIIGIPEN